jgi:transcriptional regulator with XRE-family HTH domain
VTHYRKLIAATIKEIRRARGITQEELAELYNATSPKTLTTTRGAVAKYEVGLAECPASKFLKFQRLAS